MNMRIVLDKKTQKFIADKVAAGEYDDPSEVVRDAMKLLREKDMKKRERLRKSVDAGFDEIAKGQFDSVKPGQVGAFIRSLKPKPAADAAASRRTAARRK